LRLKDNHQNHLRQRAMREENAKREFMVRSEGGRICCDINELSGSFKE
jgi:hypothetical protein